MTDNNDQSALLDDFDDEELRVVVKSLSLTYDATSRRVDRLTGRHRAEALTEVLICDRALTKAKAEMAQRWTDGEPPRVWPIGTIPPEKQR